MSLNTRIARVEKFVGTIEPSCPLCGAPETIGPDYVITPHKNPLSRCEGCGRELDDHGVPAPTMYKRYVLAHPELV